MTPPSADAVGRSRSRVRLPITLSVALMVINVTLMVCWIVLLAGYKFWSALTVGTVLFVLVLVGLSIYLALTLKEVNLNRRQANFIDSVTHELKSPIAALRLYLQTLQIREVSDERRNEFFGVMTGELNRLDRLISQLLEVGRLDALDELSRPEDVALGPLLGECAKSSCAAFEADFGRTVHLDVEPCEVHGRVLLLETVFRNLIDNAIKYAGRPRQVWIEVRPRDRKRVVVRIADNGGGVPAEMRQKIFGLFYRGGDELQRRTKGTGLGLYIVYTLLRRMKGRISVHDRRNGAGTVFEVELPGWPTTS